MQALGAAGFDIGSEVSAEEVILKALTSTGDTKTLTDNAVNGAVTDGTGVDAKTLTGNQPDLGAVNGIANGVPRADLYTPGTPAKVKVTKDFLNSMKGIESKVSPSTYAATVKDFKQKSALLNSVSPNAQNLFFTALRDPGVRPVTFEKEVKLWKNSYFVSRETLETAENSVITIEDMHNELILPSNLPQGASDLAKRKFDINKDDIKALDSSDINQLTAAFVEKKISWSNEAFIEARTGEFSEMSSKDISKIANFLLLDFMSSSKYFKYDTTAHLGFGEELQKRPDFDKIFAAGGTADEYVTNVINDVKKNVQAYLRNSGGKTMSLQEVGSLGLLPPKLVRVLKTLGSAKKFE
jgi:hypothetical protein